MSKDTFIGAMIVLILAAVMVLALFLTGVVDLVKAIKNRKGKK